PGGLSHPPLLPADRVRGVEALRALSAGQRTGGLAVPVVQVAGRAGADPRRELVRDRSVVQSLALVAELCGHTLPFRSVPRVRPRDRVRDLVQQHLVDLVVLVAAGEVARDTDAAVGVVAEPRPRLRVVEAERPCRLEVQRDERVRPGAHSVQVCHATTLTPASDLAKLALL